MSDEQKEMATEIALEILCKLSGENAYRWNDNRKMEERIAFLHKQVAALAAENERLRKEVDAMKHWIVWKGYDFPCVNDLSAAAKEGGDTK